MGIKNKIRKNKFLRKIYNKFNPYNLNVPPGHYYSPVPSIEDIQTNEEKIFNATREIKGITISKEKHTEYIENFKKYYSLLPFTSEKINENRYYYNNVMFGESTGALLFCFMHHLQPKKIIEVGSGFSSALMLDTNNKFFGNTIDLTFIEPYPQRLESLIRKGDKATIYRKKLQDIDPALFTSLEENDILFIDSSHISKIGSDVNFLFFEILPLLKKGVFIHIHDIFYPFEYPKKWIYSGIFWNELYMLRAFLMYNNSFSVEFFNTYAITACQQELMDLPFFSENVGGSIWLRKND